MLSSTVQTTIGVYAGTTGALLSRSASITCLSNFKCASRPNRHSSIPADLTSGASRTRSDLRAAGEAHRARLIAEREPRKAEQDGARTIKPSVAPHRI